MIESTPPKLTKEERLAALEAAKVARVKRAEVKKKLASGEMSVEEAISIAKNRRLKGLGWKQAKELIDRLP